MRRKTYGNFNIYFLHNKPLEKTLTPSTQNEALQSFFLGRFVESLDGESTT